MQTRYFSPLDEPAFAFADIDTTLTINGRPLHATVLAIAPRELKVKVPLFCPRWASVGIRLAQRYAEQGVHCLGEIHWFERSGTSWELGIWLDEPLDESLVANHWQDMRRELRYDINWAAVAQWPSGRKQTIQIVGYSIGGITVSSGTRLPGDSEFLLWRSFDPGPAVACAVTKWTSEVGEGQYLMGCMLPGDGGYDLARAFMGKSRSLPQSTPADNERQLEIARTLLQFPNY